MLMFMREAESCSMFDVFFFTFVISIIGSWFMFIDEVMYCVSMGYLFNA